MKTGGTQVKYKAGDVLVCVKSHSCGYTEGNRYEVYENRNGWKCLMADDGFSDPLSLLVSEFKKYE